MDRFLLQRTSGFRSAERPEKASRFSIPAQFPRVWDLANAETPDLAGTTWSFVGGCLDGVEMEQEELDYTLEQYGGKLDLAFAEDGTVQMVQGAGAWDGTYEYLEDGGISMNIDADGTALNYTGIFSMVGDQLVLMLLNAGDAEGLSGLHFVQ